MNPSINRLYKVILFFFLLVLWETSSAQPKPEILNFEPFIWKSEIPSDCPFQQSDMFNGIKFLGIKSGFHYGDTWYPTWAANDTLYSPWTDGSSSRLDGYREDSNSWGDQTHYTTAQGVLVGNEPTTLTAYSIGTYRSAAMPYHGRYPCGSLV